MSIIAPESFRCANGCGWNSNRRPLGDVNAIDAIPFGIQDRFAERHDIVVIGLRKGCGLSIVVVAC